MAVINLGRTSWSAKRTDEGHRQYTIKFKVRAGTNDGPQTVTFAPGLPTIGSTWSYGADSDPWAFCTPFIDVKPLTSEEPNELWSLEYHFTTVPMNRCNTTNIENPLAEPQKISGSFRNSTIKAAKDKDGNAIQTTSFETVLVEFDNNLPSVRIEQNVLDLGLATFTPMVNTVNNASLWGLGARRIKLTNVSWDRKLYGVCFFYYTRVLEFEVNFNTFDRDDVPNKGKKVIRGSWNSAGTVYTIDGSASVGDAKDYIARQDPKGNLVEGYIDSSTGGPQAAPTFLSTVQGYGESNFLSLGIPSVL